MLLIWVKKEKGMVFNVVPILTDQSERHTSMYINTETDPGKTLMKSERHDSIYMYQYWNRPRQNTDEKWKALYHDEPVKKMYVVNTHTHTHTHTHTPRRLEWKLYSPKPQTDALQSICILAHSQQFLQNANPMKHCTELTECCHFADPWSAGQLGPSTLPHSPLQSGATSVQRNVHQSNVTTSWFCSQGKTLGYDRKRSVLCPCSSQALYDRKPSVFCLQPSPLW